MHGGSPFVLNTGGIEMKAIVTSLFITLITITSANANTFGSFDTNTGFDQKIEESVEIVKASRELRKSLRNDRSIAGMTSNDEKWANEFEKIMADNKTDYLNKAFQIND